MPDLYEKPVTSMHPDALHLRRGATARTTFI